MGDARGEGDDGIDALGFDAVLGLDALLGDVAEDGHAAAALGALLLADAGQVERQEARLRITHLEFAREGADGLR